MELRLGVEHEHLVDGQDDLENLVIDDVLSSASSGLQSARSERPYSFIRNNPGDSQEKHDIGVFLTSSDEVTRTMDDVLQKDNRLSASRYTQKTLVSPELVTIPSTCGDAYHLSDDEQKSFDGIGSKIGLVESKTIDSPPIENQMLSESALDPKQLDYCPEQSRKNIANLQERLADFKEKHPEAAELAQEARDSERVLELLTNATTDEPSFLAELSALQEVQELWRTTRPELYRLVLKYGAVREQIRLLMKADRNKDYQDTLMSDLLDAKKTLADLKATHPDVYELIADTALVQSQIASISRAMSHKGHLSDRLTCLRASLHKLQADNQEIFAQQAELRQLEDDIRDLQEFSDNRAKFNAYKSSVLAAYEALQLEHPDLVASFLDLKQLKHELDTIKRVKDGLINIEGEVHDARQQLKQFRESNLELVSLLEEKKRIEEDITEIRNGIQNITQIADVLRSLQDIYENIKAENPELVELLDRRRALKDKVVQLRTSIKNQKYLEDEVADMQHLLDELSRKHPDVLLLLDRKKELQAALESLKLYATNVSVLERDIETKTRTYVELCSIFPDIKERILKRKYIEEDIALFKSFSKDPARLARDTLALSNAYEQCRAMSPVITSMLDTRTSLVDLVSESAQCNELGLRNLREVHSDELYDSISAPPPEPLPSERGRRASESRQQQQQPRPPEYGQEFTESGIADRILNVDLPNMMCNFFGISTPQTKKGQKLKTVSSPLRRTIS